MSHSSGTVTFEDGAVWWCEYNGTSDIMIPTIYPTHDEMSANWRNHEWNQCSCESGMEPVKIHADYGSGMNWTGEACRKCKAINHEHLDSFWLENKEYEERKQAELEAFYKFLSGEDK